MRIWLRSCNTKLAVPSIGSVICELMWDAIVVMSMKIMECTEV